MSRDCKNIISQLLQTIISKRKYWLLHTKLITLNKSHFLGKDPILKFIRPRNKCGQWCAVNIFDVLQSPYYVLNNPQTTILTSIVAQWMHNFYWNSLLCPPSPLCHTKMLTSLRSPHTKGQKSVKPLSAMIPKTMSGQD